MTPRIGVYPGTFDPVTNGHMDDIPIERVSDFELGLRDHFRARHADLVDHIAETGTLPEEEAMVAAIAEFKELFEA